MKTPPVAPGRSSFEDALEIEHLVRDALDRFDGKPALIVTSDGVRISSGNLIACVPQLEVFAPHLDLEFSLRGLTFRLELPNSHLMRIAASWNGSHYTAVVEGKLRVSPEK